MSEDTNSIASLLANSSDPEVPSKQNVLETNTAVKKLTNFIENTFYFTINPNTENDSIGLVFLEDLSDSLKPQTYIDIETLEQALFERLLLPDPEKHVIPKNKNCPDYVFEPRIFCYLYTVYENLEAHANTADNVIKSNMKKMYELIFRNCTTAILQPDLFELQQLPDQLLQLLSNIDTAPQKFVTEVVENYMKNDTPDSKQQLSVFMDAFLWKLCKRLHNTNILTIDSRILPIVQMFAANKHLAPILLSHMTPRDVNSGNAYQTSIIGGLLNMSVLPRFNMGKCDFFDNPLDQSAISVAEQSLWNATKYLTDGIYNVFMALLRNSSETKESLLTWIANCLKANQKRAKIWNSQAPHLEQSEVPDSFMVNLNIVLLKMCQPFCTRADDPKAMKIDPTYCAVEPSEAKSKSVHMSCLHDATCLLPARESEEGESSRRLTASTYNFITECFFMAHYSISLGYHVVAEKMGRLAQEIARVERALGGPFVAENIKMLMQNYLSFRCALLNPDAVTMLAKLHAVTSHWLVQVAAKQFPDKNVTSYAPNESVEVTLPLTGSPPDTLRCIPELLMENVTSLISLARRSDAITEGDASFLYPPALTLVLTFMGDATRMNNPHLRAHMAECLEAMLPTHPDDKQPVRESSLASFFKERLFKEHPHRLQLIPSLLDVFVGIEMTGQNVQFEQKFNYRRPMYIVMDFLWEIEEHRESLSRLALDAEKNMEAVRPPLFLRFINLLMNDAIFLLDEALSNMAQIRTMQAAKESGAWENLPRQERQQNLASLAHIGMLARFDNILGRHTIGTLSRMTQHAPHIFCHNTIADRIAAMLNYFLLHLVGPNKNTFKVKDGKEYEFNPAETVLEICRMYVQLGDNDNFCLAVSQDGRSYSSELFTLAEDVLVRIGGGSLISELQDFAVKVAKIAQTKKEEEELLADAPDHFLDPIMSTLMRDPVILPSSKTTVDRTTIARHLLSDESDPFNRSPLTMDQLIPNVDLKNEIESWIEEKKESFKQSTSQQPMDE